MAAIKAVTVFCASSPLVDGDYVRAAGDLGARLVAAGWTVIYGGGGVGLMGAVADAVLAAGGRIVGIRPRFISAIEDDRAGLTELVFTETMHERIGLLLDRGDAYVSLPGSCGTLDETVQAITWKRLGLHNKPIVLVNVNGFFDPLRRLFDDMVAQRFVTEKFHDLYHMTPDAAGAIEYLRRYVPPPLAPL